MKQAQQFQERLSSVQNELSTKQVTGSAGGGMVNAIFTGNSELVSLSIEKEIVNPSDVQMLQDLIVAAVNDGLKKAKDLGKSEMTKITGGLSIPGMF